VFDLGAIMVKVIISQDYDGCYSIVAEGGVKAELVPFPFNFDRLTCHKPCPIFV
jgi:hypothetical protein